MAKTFPQPFIGPVCILMNSDVSYHAWCQGHLSSSLSTFVFDQPLALWRRLHHEGVGTKISPIQQIWEDPTIVKLNVLSWGSWYPFLNLGWMWSLDWNTYKYTKLDNIHAGIWIFKLGIHMSLLEWAKVHWPDDGCLAYWTQMPSLELVCFEVLPKLLKIA